MILSSFRCKECGEEGDIAFVTSPKLSILKDYIPHKNDCPYRRRKQPEHFRRKAWKRQEKRANELAGSRPTSNSGAVFEDGDGRSVHKFRIECKGTKEDRYRLSEAVWQKLRKGSLRSGEEPVLHVHLGDRTNIVLVRDCLLETSRVKIETKFLDKSILSHPPKSFNLGEDVVAALSEQEFECLRKELNKH